MYVVSRRNVYRLKIHPIARGSYSKLPLYAAARLARGSGCTHSESIILVEWADSTQQRSHLSGKESGALAVTFCDIFVTLSGVFVTFNDFFVTLSDASVTFIAAFVKFSDARGAVGAPRGGRRAAPRTFL